MPQANILSLKGAASTVLSKNDRRLWTIPASHLYPHQWLWDSCFIAIGLRHLDVPRAQTELASLLRGQWSNGMLPNIIFDSGAAYRQDRELWRSRINPYSPEAVATSGITQPPMLAEAVVRVGHKLPLPQRRTWYKKMYPALVAYHQWIYRERNPHGEGLAILIHPYESGLDNSPPWISELRKHSMPLWVSLVEKLKLDRVINLFRRDTRHVPAENRSSNVEALAYWSALRRLRRRAYNSEAVLSRPLFAVEDVAFNSILVRAGALLRQIAKDIGETVPEELLNACRDTEKALEQLWDESHGMYFSRSFISHKLIQQPSIASLLPIYAGAVSKDRVRQLVAHLNNPAKFGTDYSVPSVPLDSAYFNPNRYWQGPVWLNTNWLLIDGLERYGYPKEAQIIRAKSLELVEAGGMNEYFNPLSGQPAGAADFSWTAALAIDLLNAY